jgi:copper chaperone CopZ
MLNHGLEIIQSIWYWLVFGIVASAAIHEFVPGSFLTGIGSLGIVASALAALAISLPLYVCAVASVPIAAALVAGGLPPGAALVFLMAGPATNVAAIGAIYRQFGARNLVVYLATIIVGSVGLAVAFDWLLSADPIHRIAAHESHDSWSAQACAVVLVVLLAWFAVEDLHSWWRRRRVSSVTGGAELTVAVRGMTCSGCASRLENALLQTEGVESAVVHLEPGEAIVRGSIGQTEVRDVIREAGFQAD